MGQLDEHDVAVHLRAHCQPPQRVADGHRVDAACVQVAVRQQSPLTVQVNAGKGVQEDVLAAELDDAGYQAVLEALLVLLPHGLHLEAQLESGAGPLGLRDQLAADVHGETDVEELCLFGGLDQHEGLVGAGPVEVYEEDGAVDLQLQLLLEVLRADLVQLDYVGLVGDALDAQRDELLARPEHEMGDAADLLEVLLNFYQWLVLTGSDLEEADAFAEGDDDQLVLVAVDHVDSWAVEVVRTAELALAQLPHPQQTVLADLQQLRLVVAEKHGLDALLVLEPAQRHQPRLDGLSLLFGRGVEEVLVDVALGDSDEQFGVLPALAHAEALHIDLLGLAGRVELGGGDGRGHWLALDADLVEDREFAVLEGPDDDLREFLLRGDAAGGDEGLRDREAGDHVLVLLALDDLSGLEADH